MRQNFNFNIKINHVLYRRGFGPNRKRKVAVRNFSADFEKNTNTVIMGERYGGKSTLMNIMAGTIYPTLGRVVVNGNIGFCAQVYTQINVFARA